MKKRLSKSLPVLMHHLISNDTRHISVAPSVFETQCKELAEKGWFGVGLHEAEEFLINGAPLPEKSFLLTFDDGYLDNYVYAWPIMKKYGHKGVIFAVAERLDRAQEQGAVQSPEGKSLARHTIEDVWNGTCSHEKLPAVDELIYTDELGFSRRRDMFLNWDEARLMEKSGEMAIAGHSIRHGMVFTGPSYSGFAQPGDGLRTFVQTEPESIWGMPGFACGPELSNRAFIPSPALFEAIKGLVPQEDAAAAVEFFHSPDKVTALERLVAGFKDKLGVFESEEDTARRMRGIMEANQAALQKELGHSARSFCWPWGNFCEEARKQGQAAGFDVFYTTSLGINRPGRPLSVHRFKVKNRTDTWLLNRMRLYSRPLLGSLYLKMRL